MGNLADQLKLFENFGGLTPKCMRNLVDLLRIYGTSGGLTPIYGNWMKNMMMRDDFNGFQWDLVGLNGKKSIERNGDETYH